MPRKIKSASSASSSADTLSSLKSYSTGEFSIWNMVKRGTGENAFCLTSKFRTNARIHRISDVTVTRTRREAEGVNDDVNNDSDTSNSSDISQDWEHLDEEDDDLEDLYEMISNQPSIKVAASNIIAITKMMTYRRQNSAPDPIVIEETARSGTRAQKIYLKKCDEFETAFSRRFLHSLNTPSASIAHQYVGNKGIEACIIALTQTSVVTVLNLRDNNIGFKGAKYIAMLLKNNTSITDLNVSDNKIGFRGAKYLTEVIGDTDRLSRFDISNNCLKEKDASLFRRMLEETRNLKYLNLSQNGFREEGGVILGEALSYNDGLEELELSWNHLRRDGSAGLAEGLLDNSSLKTLNLSWNGFYLEGCRVLEKALVHNNTLLTLDLTNNRINRECIDHLTRGLAKNRTLHTLILKLNPLTNDGAYDILQFINDCPSSGIKVLDLGMQQVDADFEILLTEIQMQKRSVEVIYGQVIGRRLPLDPDLETDVLKENAALILIEYANMMGFRLIDLFASLDRTGTRVMNKEELTLGLKIAGILFTDASIKKIVRKLDVNKDGRIDIREVLTAEKEHADQVSKLTEAQEEWDKQKMAAIPIWRIRNKLRKMVVEKLTDFNQFKKVSEQLAKQINSAIDAKNEDMEREEERRRLKKNRSHSTPGHVIPASQSKHLRRLHARAVADSIQENPELVGDFNDMEGVLGATASSDMYSNNMKAMTQGDVVTVRGHEDAISGLKEQNSQEPNLESDIEESLLDDQTEQKGSKSLSTFSRISEVVKVVNTKSNGQRRHVDVESVDSDDEVVPNKTLSVSTTSKTFNRDTLGTLKLAGIEDKTSKR